MAHPSPRILIFYEKPGCSSNLRQKKLLRELGFDLDERNLLTTAWNAALLRSFFGRLPVEDWFNKSAPSIKVGIVNPADLTEEEAIAAMMEDPLLIHRPLIECKNFRCAGFDLSTLAAKFNIPSQKLNSFPWPVVGCEHESRAQRCSENAEMMGEAGK